MDSTPAQSDVGELRALVRDVSDRNNELQTLVRNLIVRNNELQARVEAIEGRSPDVRPGPEAVRPQMVRADGAEAVPNEAAGSISRRGLLRASGGVAAAGLGLALAGEVLRPKSAQAAAGDLMVVGGSNDEGNRSTFLSTTSDGYALYAENSNPRGTGDGIFGRAPGKGVYGSGGELGVEGYSTAGVGGQFTGPTAELQLGGFSQRVAPTGDSIPHKVGEIIRDGAGDLWLCVADGTPGRFRKLAGPATAGAFHVLPAPVRVYDSRPYTQPSSGVKSKLVANTARVMDVTSGSNIPEEAIALAVTCLLVNTATGGGNFTIWSYGVARPLSNTMVWGGTAGRFSSPAITAVSLGSLQVLSSLSTDLVLDVVGYYL